MDDARRNATLAALAIRAKLTPVEAVALPAVISRIAAKVNRSEQAQTVVNRVKVEEELK